jgi:hypothetical protein
MANRGGSFEYFLPRHLPYRLNLTCMKPGRAPSRWWGMRLTEVATVLQKAAGVAKLSLTHISP